MDRAERPFKREFFPLIYAVVTMQTDLKAKLIAYPIAALCLYLAYLSFNIGWGSLISVRPEQAIAAWEDNIQEYNHEEARTYQIRLESAIKHSPLNAFHKLWLGRLHLLMAQSVNLESEIHHLKMAEYWLTETTKQIPTWYETWSYLGITLIRQNASFEDINQHLKQALTLGPYEDTSQKLLIPILLQNWDSLTSENQCLGRVLLSHALKYHKHSLLALNAAKDNEKLDVIEPLTKAKWHKNQIKKYRKEQAEQ